KAVVNTYQINRAVNPADVLVILHHTTVEDAETVRIDAQLAGRRKIGEGNPAMIDEPVLFTQRRDDLVGRRECSKHFIKLLVFGKLVADGVVHIKPGI